MSRVGTLLKKSSLVAAVFVVLLAIAPPAHAADKSFSIDTLKVDATLHPNGSMDVVEHFTYTFAGSFTFGTRTIPAGSYYQVVDVVVTENGQPLPMFGDADDFKWFFDATNETRVFDISYRVLNVVQVGPDVGEFYWKWIGTDHPTIGTVNVALAMPDQAADIRAWAHGPLHGQVAIQGTSVHFNVAPLPGNRFWEGRVTAPATTFTVAPTGNPRLEKILSDEQKWADDANSARDRERLKTIALNVGAVLLAVGQWIWFIYAWRRWGNDPARPGDVGRYWYDPPDVAPAVVLSTLASGTFSAKSIGATIVDLAQRGFVQITELPKKEFLGIFGRESDWRFTRKKEPDETIRPFERTLLNYVFAHSYETTQDDLEKYSKKHPTTAQAFLSRFEEEVNQDVFGTYVTKTSRTFQGGHLFMCIAVGVAAIFLLVQQAWLGVLPLLSSIVLVFFTRSMSCRTELGARKAAEWEGLRNYIDDFSNFKEAPIGHLILWERYLVYAVGFGLATELARAFAMRAPEVAANAGFASWYSASSSNNAMFTGSGLNSIGSSFASAVSPPSSSSSGSGSGGGASGGGGGGGGGGGAGAG